MSKSPPLPVTAVAALMITFFIGCATTPSDSGPIIEKADAPPARVKAEDWGEVRTSRPQPGRATSTPRTGSRTGSSRGGRKAKTSGRSSNYADGPTTVWTIVLGTFSESAHRHAARNMLQQLPTTFPDLAETAWVHTTSAGSMVVYGRYGSVESSGAQDDLKMVKTLSIQNRPAFPRAMLTRVTLRTSPARLHPFALMSARHRHPKVDPLYTLEVAIWSDFDSGKLSLEQIHSQAEAYSKKLRIDGYEAYFHHDDDKRLSTVTVGLFDRTALDPRTGLYGHAVESVLQRFPARLVNGETLREPIDGRNPSRGTRIQQPRLVHVPKL